MNMKVIIKDGKHEVFIDDMPIHQRCREVKIIDRVRCIPLVELTLIPDSIEAEGDIQFIKIDKGIEEYNLSELLGAIQSKVKEAVKKGMNRG